MRTQGQGTSCPWLQKLGADRGTGEAWRPELGGQGWAEEKGPLPSLGSHPEPGLWEPHIVSPVSQVAEARPLAGNLGRNCALGLPRAWRKGSAVGEWREQLACPLQLAADL